MGRHENVVVFPCEENENKEAITLAAEEILELARAGEITSFVVAGMTKNGQAISILPAIVPGAVTVLGALELTKADLIAAIEKQQ